MNIKDIKSLIETDEKETNPFRYLGVSEWVLKSMDSADIKKFLGDMKRIIGRYHHPDKFTDSATKNIKEIYIKRAFGAIDRLLGDDFYLKTSLDNFRTGGMLREKERLIKYKDAQISSLNEACNKLEKMLAKKEENLLHIISSFSKLKQVESQLIETSEFVALDPNLTCNISYIEPRLALTGSFYELFERGSKDHSMKNSFDLEEKFREEVTNFIDITKYSKEVKPRKNLIPMIEGELKGKRLTINPGKEKVIRVLGGVTYSAILKGNEFYGNSFFPFSDSSCDFIFKTLPGEGSKDQRTKKILPFLSNFIFPKTFVSVNETNYSRGKPKGESYYLIFPVEISNIQYNA